MWHTVTISFSTKNKNWIILKLTFSPSNMNQSTICCTARAFDILRLDWGVTLCLLFKHKKVCSDQREIGNYWGLLVARIVTGIVMAITYMFEVGCSVEVSNVDARSGRWVGSLHWDQLAELHPPELSLCWRTEKWFMLLKILTRLDGGRNKKLHFKWLLNIISRFFLISLCHQQIVCLHN